MRKTKGFSLVELLIAAGLITIILGIIYGLYQAETRTYQMNKRKINAVDKLWLTMDRIKWDAREGKKFVDHDNFNFPTPIPDPPCCLVFSTDSQTIAYFESNATLYKAISGDTTAQTIAVGVSMSAITEASGSVQIHLTTSWSYKDITKQVSISSVVNLRNWGR